MTTFLSILQWFFNVLAAFALALISIPFSQGQRKKYRFLRWKDGRQFRIFLAAMLAVVVGNGLPVLRERLTAKPSVETVLSPEGQPTQRATSAGLAKELEDAATELKRAATDYFNAGFREMEDLDYEDAAQNFQKSVETLPTMSGYFNFEMASQYIPKLAQAEKAFLSGLEISRKRHNKNFEGSFLSELGVIYGRQNNFDQALALFNQALTLFQETRNRQGEAVVASNLANLYSLRGQFADASKYIEKAKKIAQEDHIVSLEAGTLVISGNIHFENWELSEALQDYQNSLVFDAQLPRSKLQQADTMANIGNTYDEMALGQNGVIDKSMEEKSFSSYESAHQIYKETASQQKGAEGLNEIIAREAKLLVDVAEVYEHLGKTEYALTSLEEPIRFAEKNNQLNLLASALIVRGSCSLALRRQKDAIASFDAAFKAAQQSANPLLQARAQAFMGEYYVAEKNNKEALIHFTEARDLFRQAGVKGRGVQLVENRIQTLTAATRNPAEQR